MGHGREAGKMSEEGVPAPPEEIEAKISQLKDKRGSLREERAMLVESVRGMRASASESREKSSSRRTSLRVQIQGVEQPGLSHPVLSLRYLLFFSFHEID